jgi:Domain of unknown function (DUF4276)
MQIAVQFAALRENCAGILVLFDADDDCPRELAPTLECWAREAAGGRPCAVVMAKREYEAWFLASIEALRGRRGVLPMQLHTPIRSRLAMLKASWNDGMRPGASYSASVDQAAMTAHLDLESAYRRCRSFRKLVSAFGTLAAAAGVAPPVWPPAAWVQLTSGA